MDLKFINIGGERICLNSIKDYAICSNKLIYRNDKQVQGIIQNLVSDKSDLWDTVSFKLLNIRMTDGKYYNYYSDSNVYVQYKKMLSYFKERGCVGVPAYGTNESILYGDGDLNERQKEAGASLDIMFSDKFTYINESIYDIVDKLDGQFTI